MKIAFYQPYIANWRIDFLQRFIAECSHKVIVYDGGFSSRNDTKSVTGNKTSFPVIRLTSCSPVIQFRSQSYPLYFSPFLIFSLIRQRPDCVITEGEINFLNNISILVYCRIFRKRFVWWSLGKVRTRRKNVINRLLDPIVDFLLRQSDCIMARNTYAKDYYISEKNIAPDSIIVAPNSMDERRARAEVSGRLPELLDDKKDKKIVLYVGAMTPEKRPGDLLDVLRFLHDMGRKDIAVWFVGDGSERIRLEELSRELGLEDNCRFWGKVFSGVGDFFIASDLVVVPGLGGLVINHAMIFGKPVISRVADGTELDLIKNGQNGFILDNYDNKSLADALLKILDSPDYPSMCDLSREIVDQHWNMGLMISRVEDCVRKACE